MTEQLRRYLEGYISPTRWQDPNVKGDPQLSGLRVFLASKLSQLSSSCDIIDIGMGSGLLAKVLMELKPFIEGEQRYFGIDIDLEADSLAVSGIDTGLIAAQRARYYKFDDFVDGALAKERFGNVVVILRNVFHEIDLESLARTFTELLSLKADSLSVLIQDMARLPKAEIGNAPWSADSVQSLLNKLGFSGIVNVTDESKSSTPWFTIWADRGTTLNIHQIDILRDIVSIRQSHLKTLKKLGDKLLLEDSEDRRLQILAIQNDVFAIDRSVRVARAAITKHESIILTGEPNRVRRVSWSEIENTINNFCSNNSIIYDLIIGIGRGGLPIATAMSHRYSDAKFAVVMKSYADTDTRPFFVFEDGESVRSQRDRRIDAFILPVIHGNIESVLIVDDVTTFGNTLAMGEDLVRARLGVSVNISFFTFACDADRLSASKPDIYSRLKTGEIIDNKNTWLLFPWEAPASATD